MRWIVGDIHGCVAELERLLRAICLDPAVDELWTVGDIVNTGPDSAAAVRLWMDAGGKGVIGNHDLYALRVHGGFRRREQDTLDDLFEARDVEQLMEALDAMPVMQHLPAGDGIPDAWLVHAGLPPDCGPLDEFAQLVNRRPRNEAWLMSPEIAFTTRVRCCLASGEMMDVAVTPEMCPGESLPWDRFYEGEALIVHGHWAHRRYYRGKRTLGLDSGCVYGGKLTAWCLEEDRIVQVQGLL
jgi:bis(5'-nucleosyl)-tetraphosphatase (symmetrical)